MNCHVGFKTFLRGLAPVMLAIASLMCSQPARATEPAASLDVAATHVLADSLEMLVGRGEREGADSRAPALQVDRPSAQTVAKTRRASLRNPRVRRGALSAAASYHYFSRWAAPILTVRFSSPILGVGF